MKEVCTRMIDVERETKRQRESERAWQNNLEKIIESQICTRFCFGGTEKKEKNAVVFYGFEMNMNIGNFENKSAFTKIQINVLLRKTRSSVECKPNGKKEVISIHMLCATLAHCH